MAQQSQNPDKKLNEQILKFSRHIAGSDKIKAACIYSYGSPDPPVARTAIEALLVIPDFQPKLMHYMKNFDERNVVVVAVDQWIFERDIDRGFLGEALAWGLIFPYLPLTNAEYLRSQEIKLKKRLILELLENLVLDYPELSYELRVKPEYFMYQSMLSRTRLFPPMAHSLRKLMQKGGERKNTDQILHGYLEALKELEKEDIIHFSKDYVRISESFAKNAQNPMVRLANLTRTVPRTMFTSLLGVLQRILKVLSQDTETLLKLQWTAEKGKIALQIENPDEYLFVPIASGLVPISNRTSIETFARKVLSPTKDAKISVEALGGILNDVYLVKTSANGDERKAVAKKFKDWSSFKWFPLTLWSAGTRTFTVLARSRLEKECAINQFLYSRGITVPKLLHVSPEERLVFMEYVEGEDASHIIKRLAESKQAAARKELKIIERIGRKFAKVHALNIALGDTKPENIMIGKGSEIYLMDFEQASRNGDKAWDVAEFLYYAGHDIPPDVETRTAELLAEAFISGYLAAGGDADIIRKAGNPKYTKVFSVFTLPHVMLTISNVCRKTGKSKI